ncbi:MAG TPA: ATP-binding cassette domain-containing protein [Planctomycetota bacterium]|nr:ATP-binding cassette domain-containing protein [Planctomycetota bacterium]
MPTSEPIVSVESLSHDYGERRALDNLSFSASRGEIFGLLGPNGGGKTTTFRILSTLIRPTSGKVGIFGFDLLNKPREIQKRIGVVFQAPSLDKKLTAYENLHHQGRLYGLGGAQLSSRIGYLLDRVKLGDRANEYVETFSGGMRRRVELAKGLLHGPKLLLLDEPSTGLDPGARRDLWQYLRELAQQEGVTSLLTTHYMEEAAQCTRIAILNAGKLVALGAPDELRATIGGDVITIQSPNPEELQKNIAAQFSLNAELIDGTLRVETPRGHELVAKLGGAFPGAIDSMTISKPTLDDVFIKKTGHKFWVETEPSANGKDKKKKRR